MIRLLASLVALSLAAAPRMRPPVPHAAFPHLRESRLTHPQ